MHGKIVQMPDRHIMGAMARIEPGDADYVALWRSGFDPHEPTISAMATEPGY